MTARTWFITGINSGFGRNMAEQLLERGDRVAGTVRKLDSVADLAEKWGDRLWLGTLDVTSTVDVRATVDRAFADLGRIDVVINNAGYGLFGAAEEVSDEQISQIIDTNLIGSIQVARAALPHLRAQSGGRIIQLSTVGGQIAGPGVSLYSASKWGIEGFMEALAPEVAEFGIGVTIVEPGSARTQFRYGSMQMATPLAAYDGSAAARLRGIQDPAVPSNGDPARMAARIIASVDTTPAPLRLSLGTDSYTPIKAALESRLALLEAQKSISFSTDYPDGE